MQQKLTTMNKYRITVTILIFLFFLAIFVVSVSYSTRSVPEEPLQVTTLKNTDLQFEWEYKNESTAPLKVGDSLSVLGYYGDTYWVETRDGKRGTVKRDAIDNKVIINSKSPTMVGDTLELVRMETPIKAVCKAKDGEEYYFIDYAYTYLTKTQLSDYQLKDKMGRIHMSKKHFEKMCATKTSAELDSLWDHARYVCPTDSGLMMYFNIAVLDPKGHIYYPTLLFHDHSSPTINWGKDQDFMNGWLLRLLPGTGLIVDLFHVAIDGFYYQVSSLNALPWYIYYPGYLVFLFFFMLWLFCGYYFVYEFFDIFLPMRRPYQFMSNTALKWFLWGVFAISTYVWVVLTMVWGCWWFLLIIGMFFPVAYVFSSILDDIYRRCPHCHSFDQFKTTEERHTGRSFFSEVRSRLVDSIKGKTKIRETYKVMSDGSIKDRVVHTETDIHNKYEDIKDTYQTDSYTDTRVCSCCGKRWEFDYEKEDRLVKSEKTGTHTEMGKEYKSERK